MRPNEILSVVPDLEEPSTEQKFLLFAKATCDAVRDYPDIAMDLSHRLDDAGLETLARSLRVLSDRARYPSSHKEQP